MSPSRGIREGELHLNKRTLEKLQGEDSDVRGGLSVEKANTRWRQSRKTGTQLLHFMRDRNNGTNPRGKGRRKKERKMNVLSLGK